MIVWLDQLVCHLSVDLLSYCVRVMPRLHDAFDFLIQFGIQRNQNSQRFTNQTSKVGVNIALSTEESDRLVQREFHTSTKLKICAGFLPFSNLKSWLQVFSERLKTWDRAHRSFLVSSDAVYPSKRLLKRPSKLTTFQFYRGMEGSQNRKLDSFRIFVCSRNWNLPLRAQKKAHYIH